ncbi:uncharacterized protein BJ171DRAFT_476959 [Polychytrium aggregatum]|uniref:uncharacterized protein n=1 Tax=Polychytrium aggregatum TaxID=110093 RepID=UPI0022FDECBB|nr:uncharacterized protein BJ171DRAFT_476959 [Polychytrium aggregatum]KAI9202068.1 hypothetical protein BJ171DRAFT_476959 [Polychytrium aggregatum]
MLAPKDSSFPAALQALRNSPARLTITTSGTALLVLLATLGSTPGSLALSLEKRDKFENMGLNVWAIVACIVTMIIGCLRCAYISQKNRMMLADGTRAAEICIELGPDGEMSSSPERTEPLPPYSPRLQPTPSQANLSIAVPAPAYEPPK